MQAASGAAMMGSLQVVVCAKGSCFPSKGYGIRVFPQNRRMNILKLRKSSNVEASMVAGKQSSSLSVTVPDIEGEILSIVIHQFYDLFEKNGISVWSM